MKAVAITLPKKMAIVVTPKAAPGAIFITDTSIPTVIGIVILKNIIPRRDMIMI